MELIDTHSHLNFWAFEETWEEVVDRAQQRGVVAVVMPGSQFPTSVRAIELARQRPGFLFAAVGLHPTHVSGKSEIRNSKSETEGKFEDFDYERYLELARRPEVMAIGEVGLDTYRVQDQKSNLKNQNDNSKFKIKEVLKAQEDVLKQFIIIAQETKKPLILHCRGARKPESGIRN